MKRAFDIAMSSVLLLLAFPIILVGALVSMLELRASPLFVQERVGRNGEPFRFFKLRTLPVHVHAYLDKHQLDGLELPRGCRLMRRLHLDELPQLALVLRGHMSLVGPRPEMAHLHDAMPGPFAAERTAVRPGCTGLWQISESCVGLISSAPHYDSFYLRNDSLRLDVWILFRTALKMFSLGGPVSLDSIPGWALSGATGESGATEPKTDAVVARASAGR